MLLIVAAGGGFKQVLVDSGIAKVIASWVEGSHPLAAAAGLVRRRADPAGHRLGDRRDHHGGRHPAAGAPSTSSTTHVSLLVLAIGAGSLFFSHVNDAGFWLTKQYFGLSVSQNIKSWSMMETLLSVTGILVVLALGLVV